MLGVFRRHWKPKRTSNSRKTKDKTKESSDDKSVEVLGAIVVTGHLLKDPEGDNGKQSELDGETEKSDPVKEPAERQTIDVSQEKVQKDGLKEQIEREKMLRTEAEAQLREVHLESERCKTRLISLQEDFSKMEEMVCNMLQFKSRIEQLKHEKSSITLAYESKIRKYQSCIASLEKENFMLLNEIRSLQMQKNQDYQDEWEHSLSWILLERLRLLEQENSSLVIENEQQQLQYEHCLDDVANQVVQALLAQKGLREECAKLQRRVQDLERQNHALGIIFKQCLFHNSDNSDQPEKDSLNIWPKSPEIQVRGDTWFENTQAYKNSQPQHLHHDSPSHNSHSEDSTESLASMCSDYSAHSGSSGGNPLSHPGLPKMTSPPQWMKEGLCDRRASRISPISFIKNPSCFNNRSGQLKSKFETVSRHLESTRQTGCECRHSLFDNTQFRSVMQPTLQTISHLQESNLPSDRCDWGKWREGFYRTRILSTDAGSLDSMETPSDDCLNADSLSLLSSSQRLLVSSQYKPIHNVWVPKAEQPKSRHHKQRIKTGHNNGVSVTPSFNRTVNNSAGQNCIYRPRSSVPIPTVIAPVHSVSRPTTLNIIPHIMGDPAHNFEFPALEHKDHIINECGNVYEDLDAPMFPGSALNCSTSCSTASEPFEEENMVTNQLGSSSEEGEVAMNTVIRKTHAVNTTNEIDCQSTNTQLTGQQPRIPARELPPTPISDGFNCDKASYKSQEWKSANQTIVLRSCINSTLQDPANSHINPLTNVTIQETNSPLSVVTEHGNKDEGYSTMSSDVQGELSADSVSHTKQPCSSPLPVHSSGYVSVKSLPDLAEEDRGETLGLTEDALDSHSHVHNFQPICGEDVEEVSGFERDLDGSLIRNSKCDKERVDTCCRKDDIETASEVSKDIEYHNSSDNIVSEIECNLSGDTSKSFLTHSARSRILPTYDKLLTLLTPQGFKSHRSDSRRVTLPFIQYSESLDGTYPPKQRVQTAEKATITDPDCSNRLAMAELLNKSDLSISSNGSDGRVKAIKTLFECKDSISNLNFKEKDIGKPITSDHSATYKDFNNRPRSSIDTFNRECCSSGKTYSRYHERCLHGYHHCSCHHEGKCSVQDCVDAMCCNCNIARTLSDSHLFIRNFCAHPFELAKAASVNTKHPATRLNMVPLECHTSACDLSNSLQLTPPLRRSQRQVLVADDLLSDDNKQDQAVLCEKRIWKRDSQCSPSLSLSSVHSSTSLETGCAEEDEELGAASLKCSVHPDLTSESEDECGILEHHSFVEEWLQREEPQLPFKHQNCYTYDEEEIGNWSLQPSNEDVRNIVSGSEVWEGHWNSHQEQPYDKVYVHQLERIQETNLEDECQADYWSAQWNSNTTLESEQINTQQQSGLSDVKPNENIDCKIKENEEECNVVSDSVLSLQTQESKHQDTVHSFKENVHETTTSSDQLSLDVSKDDSSNISVVEEKNEFNGLQSEATEFNRDFYRLCTVGSTRSLVISECESHNEAEHVPESTSENQLPSIDATLSTVDKEESLAVLADGVLIVPAEESMTTTAEETATVLAEITEDATGDNSSVDKTMPRESYETLNKITDENSTVEISKESIVTALIPKKNKMKAARSVDMKNGMNAAGKHPYSRVMIDKLYIHERTKITTSKKQTPDRKKRHISRSSSSCKTKTENLDDRSIKLFKDDINQSSVKKTASGRKITRQITRESCREITGCINTAVATISENESKKINNKKERRDIKMKNHILKNVPHTKAKSVKINEISGLSEKDGTDFEKKLAGEQGHLSVADKIQELNALLLKDEKGQSILPAHKMKTKKTQCTDSKNSFSEPATKHIQMKEHVTFKKTSIKEGCGTSWVHVEADIDLSDPKARANLLDSMMASSSSSGTEDEGDDEVLEHKQHERLHALHRFRRHRKRATGKDAAISFIPRVRASIIDRHDFYFRYGEKEMEAVSCFDFLDDMSTSPSDGGSCELLGRESVENNNNVSNHIISVYTDNPTNTNRLSLDDSRLSSNKRHLSENRLSSTTLNSQDICEVVDHISLSDSCAESYSSSTHSLNQIV